MTTEKSDSKMLTQSTTRRQFAQMMGGAGMLVGTGLGFAGSPVRAQEADCPPEGAASLPEEVIVGSLGDPPNSNPILATATDGMFRAHLMFDSLIELDGATLEPIPRLAASWTISEDGLTYTFDLVENATWHDGEPVTADDVAFTVYSILHPDYTGPYRSSWEVLAGADEVVSGAATEIDAIAIESPHRITFTLAAPYAPFLGLAAARLMVIPKHVLEGVDIGTMLESDFEQAPTGSGPYKFVSYTRNADFVVEAYEGYWGGAPVIKRVINRVIPDSQSLVIALETGELHGSLYALPSQAELLTSLGTLEVITAPYSFPDNLIFQHDDPVLSNKSIRQAISLGIDTDVFSQEFLNGLGAPGAGPIAPSNWAYDASIPPNIYDPARARELLEADGWVLGDDGIYAKDGVRAAFTYTTNQGNVMREDFGTFVQAQLREVGIEATPEFIEWSLLVTSVGNGQYQTIFSSFFGARVDPDELYGQFHTDGANNSANYSNPELDALLEAGRASVDRAERIEIYAQVQTLLMEEIPTYWAWYRPYIHVIDSRFSGPWIIPSILTDGIFWNVARWGTCA